MKQYLFKNKLMFFVQVLDIILNFLQVSSIIPIGDLLRYYTVEVKKLPILTCDSLQVFAKLHRHTVHIGDRYHSYPSWFL